MLERPIPLACRQFDREPTLHALANGSLVFRAPGQPDENIEAYDSFSECFHARREALRLTALIPGFRNLNGLADQAERQSQRRK